MAASHAFNLPEAEGTQDFKMIDVGTKRPTKRRAIASGQILMSRGAFTKLREKSLPKGDPLPMAEIAGVLGVKKTPEILPMCHTLPIEQALVQCVLDEQKTAVQVFGQVATFGKTGVEMEALMATNAALLTLWDLLKSTDPFLTITETRLLVKTGGKSGVWVNKDYTPEWLLEQLPPADKMAGKTAGVLVMSDRASQGVYEDASGQLLHKYLTENGADMPFYEIIPDEADRIETAIKEAVSTHQPDVLFACGGTGPGPRDVTPEVVEKTCDRMLDGLGELLRYESGYFTETAWLSRMTAGMAGATLVIALPGSAKAVKECIEIMEPFLGLAIERIAKQGYKK